MIRSIVFVHGLTGRRASTWTSKGPSGLWPKTLLAPEFPKARIMGHGYDADAIRISGPASLNTLRDHAQNFALSLSNSRRSAPDRPLILVGHSLGGLLCEQVR